MGPSTTFMLLSLLASASGQNWNFSEGFTSSSWRPIDYFHYYSSPAQKAMHSVYSSLAAEYRKLADPQDYPDQYNPADNEVFDFVVIGAGSAGSVVANRLSEITGWRVLLLEAGGNPTRTSEIPRFYRYLLNSKLDWQYHTDPEEANCLGMKDHRCNWNGGKVLGGSSSINSMVYDRGNEEDYNRWAAEGSTGWEFENVLYYFKKSEDLRIKHMLRSPDFNDYHGSGGYLKVEDFETDEVKPLADAFYEGMQELGYDRNYDINGKNSSGFVKLPGTLHNGRRCSTAEAFLKPIKYRWNLKVSKFSVVTKILIDQNTRSVMGVTFVNNNGKLITVRANKEVILSAGVINSPHLLMLSGIGPREHLEEMNIRVIQDLPVGENLQDQMNMFGLVISLNHTKPNEALANSMYNFLMKKKSRLSGLGLHSYAGFVHTLRDMSYPDFKVLMKNFNKNDKSLESELKTRSFTQDIVNKFLEVNHESSIVLVSCSLLRPHSRGKISLKGMDTYQHPQISSGYYTDYRDVQVLLRVYDFLYKLTQTRALRQLQAKLHEIEVPGCWRFTSGSREYRECSMRHLTTTSYNVCGSCRMGPSNSPISVVDPRLRVRGISRLRIIDASVMPRMISGSTNAAAIMIGEKGADLIKEDWFTLPRDNNN